VYFITLLDTTTFIIRRVDEPEQIDRDNFELDISIFLNLR